MARKRFPRFFVSVRKSVPQFPPLADIFVRKNRRIEKWPKSPFFHRGGGGGSGAKVKKSRNFLVFSRHPFLANFHKYLSFSRSLDERWRVLSGAGDVAVRCAFFSKHTGHDLDLGVDF